MYRIIRVSCDFEVVVVAKTPEDGNEFGDTFVHWPSRFHEHSQNLEVADAGNVEDVFAKVDKRFVMVNFFSGISDMMSFGPIPEGEFDSLYDVWLHKRGYDLREMQDHVAWFNVMIIEGAGEDEVNYRSLVRDSARKWLKIADVTQAKMEIHPGVHQHMRDLARTEEVS